MATAVAAVCCLLLIRLASAQDQVLNVTSADGLQAAILARAPFIRITQHLDLTRLNPGTAKAGTLSFPGDLISMVIWGECADVPIPTMDYYDRVAKLKKTGACGMYSAAQVDGTNKLRSAIKHTSGRLLLANLLIHTAAEPGMKMNVGVSVYNAQLWMETVVFAGFSQSAVYSLDSDVYMIGSWTYQKGLGPSPEGGVNFLVLTDTEDSFKLFLGNTVFHADWMNQYAPVYVGRADDSGQNTTLDGIHGSSQPLRGRPLIVSHETIQHVHSSDGGGFRGDCVGICVWAEGGSTVDLYTNSTKPVERGDPQYIPLPASFPPNVSIPAKDASLVKWADVVPDMQAHQDWVTQLREAGVFGVDMLWDPVAHTTGLAPPSPPSGYNENDETDQNGKGGGGSSHKGLIIGVAAAGGALVLLLLCLALFFILRRRRRKDASKSAENVKAPPSPPTSVGVKPAGAPVISAGPYAHSDADEYPPGLHAVAVAPSTPTDSVRSRQSERSRFTEPPTRGTYDVLAKTLPPPSPAESASPFTRMTSTPPPLRVRVPQNDSAHESIAEQMSESSLASSHNANHSAHPPPPVAPRSGHPHPLSHHSSFGSSHSSYPDRYARATSLPPPGRYYGADPYYGPEPYPQDYPPHYHPYPPHYYPPPPHAMYRYGPYGPYRHDADLREYDDFAARDDPQRMRDSNEGASDSGASGHGSRSPNKHNPRLSPSLALQLHPIPTYHFSPHPLPPLSSERTSLRSVDSKRDSHGGAGAPPPPKDAHSSLASLERTTFNHTETRTTASVGSDYTHDRLQLSENVIPKSQLSKFELLEHQLDALEKKGGVLLKRYRMQGSSRRRYGGQGVVQFAKMVFNSKKKVAIKFFLSRSAFENEQALYLDTRLHKILPPVDEIYNNNDGSLRDPLGRVIPPFVVMEKGEPLSEWAQRQVPDFASCMQIIMHLAERVGELHSFGLVHCDLKPTNTIWLSSRNLWTIIDFGSSGRAGEPISLSVSLGYSAPELVTAHLQGERTCIANPAVDVYSIAVMAWELLTNTPAFPKGPGLFAAVAASVQGGLLPWEDTNAATYHAHMRKLGFMHDALMMMLQRDPAARPTLKDVTQMWRRALQQETAATAAAMSQRPLSGGSSPTNEEHAP